MEEKGLVKAYNVEVDCANCALQIEEAVRKIDGVDSAVVNFMAQKLIIAFKPDADRDAIIKKVKKAGKRIDSDFEFV